MRIVADDGTCVTKAALMALQDIIGEGLQLDIQSMNALFQSLLKRVKNMERKGIELKTFLKSYNSKT